MCACPAPRTLSLPRRGFLRRLGAGATVLAAMPWVVPRRVLATERQPGANDRVGIAIIGCGRRGDNYLGGGLPARAQVVAVCDVDRTRAQRFAQRTGCRVAVQDYRQILERPDIDGVMVATPDHWHALTAIHACQAGKHVYVEKPMTFTIGEGRRMVEVARKYRRAVQVGSQQRSTEPNRAGCELIRSGGLGKVERAITSNLSSPWVLRFAAQPLPEGLDWDRWCGPSPLLPFHNDLFNCGGDPSWLVCRDFAVGRMGNWGGHALDQVQWALGADGSGPVEVLVDGPRLQPPVYEQPESRERGQRLCSQPSIAFLYASGTVLELSHGPLSGAIFLGEKGKVEIRRGSLHSNPKELIENVQIPDGPKYTQAHVDNWFTCMESGELPVADVEIGHRTATLCHLGNIGRRLGRNLRWDPVAERFLGDDEANSLLDRKRRKGYELPEAV